MVFCYMRDDVLPLKVGVEERRQIRTIVVDEEGSWNERKNSSVIPPCQDRESYLTIHCDRPRMRKAQRTSPQYRYLVLSNWIFLQGEDAEK